MSITFGVISVEVRSLDDHNIWQTVEYDIGPWPGWSMQELAEHYLREGDGLDRRVIFTSPDGQETITYRQWVRECPCPLCQPHSLMSDS